MGLIVLIFLAIYSAVRIMASDMRQITNDGWVLYHSKTCVHCVTQLASIGWKSFWLDEVECNANTQKCTEKRIKVFPTWLNTNTNQIHEGKVDMAELPLTLKNAATIS